MKINFGRLERWLLGLFVAAGFCPVFLQILAVTEDIPKDKMGDYATWLGAIGAIGALFGTIILATQQQRRENRVARWDAILCAASLSLRVGHLHVAVESFREGLEQLSDDEKRPEVIAEAAKEFDLRIWGPNDVRPILAVDQKCAVLLAMSMESWVHLREVMLNCVTSSNKTEAGFEQLRISLIDMCKALEELTSNASESCDAIASRASLEQAL